MSDFPEPRLLVDVLEDYINNPVLLGERPELDPFEDDTPIECSIAGYEICESCQ